jgi:uncharacterized membrane protein YeaQ/YmgE (transglycosylase-associated protein family)
LVVNEVAAGLIGAVMGWLMMYTVRRNKPDWKVFSGLVALIVGGSGLTYVVQTGLLPYFWIGIFAGFVADIIAYSFSKDIRPSAAAH